MGCGSESELLEWCVREMKCPMDNLPLDASQVQKPRSVAPHAHAVRHAWPHVAISRAGSRIIINMLGELKRYCPYKDNGCEWQGELERVATHAKVRRRTRRGHPSCTLDRPVVTKGSVHAPTHTQSCTHTPSDILFQRIARRDAKIDKLRRAVKLRDASIAVRGCSAACSLPLPR